MAWEPFGPTREQLVAVRALEREWSDAVKTKAAAAAAVATAGVTVEAARATAAHTVKAAVVENAARLRWSTPVDRIHNRPARH